MLHQAAFPFLTAWWKGRLILWTSRAPINNWNLSFLWFFSLCLGGCSDPVPGPGAEGRKHGLQWCTNPWCQLQDEAAIARGGHRHTSVSWHQTWVPTLVYHRRGARVRIRSALGLEVAVHQPFLPAAPPDTRSQDCGHACPEGLSPSLCWMLSMICLLLIWKHRHFILMKQLKPFFTF